MGLTGGNSILSYTACSVLRVRLHRAPTMRAGLGLGDDDLVGVRVQGPATTRTTHTGLATRPRAVGLWGGSPSGVCEGGTLELWASLRGSCGLASSAASRAFRRCTSAHNADDEGILFRLR